MAEKKDKNLRAYSAVYLRDGVKVPAPQHLDGRKTAYASDRLTTIVRATIVKPSDGKEVEVAAIFRDPEGLGVTVVSALGHSIEIPMEAIAYAIPV